MQFGAYRAFRGGITGHSPMGGCLAVPIDHTQKHGAKLLPLYIPQQYAVAEQKNCRRTVLFGKPHSRTEMITTVAERTILTVLMEILLRNGNTVAERKCCCRSEFKTGNVFT